MTAVFQALLFAMLAAFLAILHYAFVLLLIPVALILSLFAWLESVLTGAWRSLKRLWRKL